MSSSTLKERCKVNTNIDSDTFVGIKVTNDEVSINFPLGFRVADDEKELRKDILLLMRVLARNTERKDSEVELSQAFENVNLPIQAYLYVISDYYARGYYKENETVHKVAKSGKINWGRTIKAQKAYIQDNDVYYLDFVTKRNSVKDNELITLIHEFCVHESFEKVGWLFTAFKPPEPQLKVNKVLFANIIKRKISETFNDRNRQLFRNMLAIIESLGDETDSREFKYGTSRFEFIWETMIDKAYGIVNKSDYFPKSRWILSDREHENAPLEPDTIMLHDGKVYVLDAKYYKYGWTGAPAHLPGSASINKQITYGEYIAENDSFKDEHGNKPTVYNAFLMPYDSYGEQFHTETDLYYTGTAISDWKTSDGLKEYEQVVGVLVDVKSLMRNYLPEKDKVVELAELIETNLIKK